MQLDKDNIIYRIAKDVYAEGGCTYFAGGYVRNHFMGFSEAGILQDIDLEIFGLKSEMFMDILLQYGEVKKVGKIYPVYKLKGYPELDFSMPTDPGMDPGEACSRRDFTINAMLINVLNSEIIDVYQGRTDLENRLLRHTGNSIFTDDPLRVYRAAGLAARFNLKIHPETMELMKNADPGDISRERIYQELSKILLQSVKPSRAFRILEESGILARAHPRLFHLINCPQFPEHHPEGDVWEHTLLVVDQAAMIKNRSKNPEILMFAALLHDIGKPLVTAERKGKITAYGHDVEGAKLAQQFLSGLGASRRVTEGVVDLVREHMRPVLLYKERHKITDRAIVKLVKRVDVRELLILSQADYNGRLQVRDYEPIRDWLLERIEAAGLKPDQGVKPMVKGQDLINNGYIPGKHFSAILDFAFDLQVEGWDKQEIINRINEAFTKSSYYH